MSTFETTITNTPADVARVPDLVANLAATHGVSSDVVSYLNVALDEALSNIIKHGYSDDRVHKIRVCLTVSNSMVVAEIEDDGRPFDPLTVPTPDLDAPLAERRAGGLGVHFMRSLMSEVSYSRVAGRNRLVLKRRLGRGKEENTDGPA